MSDYLIAALIAGAVVVANVVHRSRSPIYVRLTWVMGCTLFFFVLSVTDPEHRWFARFITLIGLVGTYRLYLKLMSEQPRQA